MSSTPNQPNPRRQFVSVAIIAKQLGVTPRSIRNYISRGLFPAYRIPGTRGVRIDPDEVNRAMRLIPATIARTGTGSFGPNANIIDLPPQRVAIEAYDPEADR